MLPVLDVKDLEFSGSVAREPLPTVNDCSRHLLQWICLITPCNCTVDLDASYLFIYLRIMIAPWLHVF